MKTFLSLVVFCVLFSGCDSPEEKPPVKAEPENRRLFKLPELKEKDSTSMDSKLDAEILKEIDWLVRAGFYDKSDLMRIICEEIYAQEDIDESLVSKTIDSQLAAWEEQKKTWPAVTDCDRLDSVFDALNKRGINAQQNSGNTQSDGYENFRYDYEEHPAPASIVGYCFYHNQDLERVVGGDGLYLAFGPVDPKEEEAKGMEVGNIIREELQKAGLKVEWDGTFNERLIVRDFVWQRR
ncbi:DUF6891 domain-containing protein [Gimesia fumaroli]|uniref:DUF6891 domain-containing protein n=1 Tax=Gimesia fumaroli TaxID=2527976 RepID=A0A518IL17_9PLAN|nr:hypothetical protein [Gimesia fumaroli]QDV53781.1 hypothetical protein Enr17x_58640 [Gimesia fumaroli]